MSFIPVEHEYEDYVRLSARLAHDGAPVSAEDVRVGDFVYVSDGPRLIVALGDYCPEHGRRQVGVADTGGPITGGWLNVHDDPASTSYVACRGGRDHFLAVADTAESQLRRWQRKAGRKHPA